jgi:hypothetical protein
LSAATRKNIVTAVNSLLTHSPSFAKQHKDATAMWRRGQRILDQLVTSMEDDNRVTDAMRAKLVDINATGEIAKQLKASLDRYKGAPTKAQLRDSQDYILLLLMVDVAPKRSDFGALRVLSSAPPKSHPGNYLILPKGRGRAATLVMKEYKTAKSHGVYIEDLPPHVSDAIRDSLTLWPRKYVFVGRNGDKLTDKAYGEVVKSTFRRRTGKNAGVNAIRHSFISQKCNPATTTTGELKQYAKAMNHSPTTQMRYHMVGAGCSRSQRR